MAPFASKHFGDKDNNYGILFWIIFVGTKTGILILYAVTKKQGCSANELYVAKCSVFIVYLILEA